MANQFGSTINEALGILKPVFEGPIVSQFNDEMPFYKNVEKGSEKYSGLKVVRPLKVRRNPGIGATSDGGNLPSLGKQTTIQAEIQAKFNYLRFGITGPLIKASQSDKGSFVRAMAYEMQEGMNDLKQDVNRQLLWDGTSDLATVSANAVASTVITVTGRETTEDGSKYLAGYEGMQLDIYRGSVQVAASVGLVSVSGTTTATLTLDTAVTVLANDIVVRSGTFGNEVQGVLVSLDGGTSSIYGVDRSVYTIFQSNVVSAASSQLTLDLMKQTWNQGKQRGGAKYDYCLTDFATERMYEKLLIADKRYVGKVKGDGTFSSKEDNYLEYGGIPMVADKDSSQQVLFLESKTWKKYVLAELEWANETGSYMIAQTGADAFEVRLRLFFNLFCEKQTANARLKGYISP